MKLLKYVVIALLVLAGAFIAWMATLDGHYDIQRSRTIKAPAEIVYSYVDDYKNWPDWSPWAETFGKDMLVSYGETTKGVGGSYSWTGKESGAGRMETIASEPFNSISQSLEFTEPYESKSNIYWNFDEADEGVKVTWGMKGDFPFLMRFFAAGMDKAMEKDFLRGLEKLDSISVNASKNMTYKIDGVVDFPLTTYAGIFSEKVSAENMPAVMGESYAKIISMLEKRKLEMTGPPFSIYTFFNEQTNESTFYSAIPVARMMPGDQKNNIEIKTVGPLKALKVTYRGPYEGMQEAWEGAFEYMSKKGLEMNDSPMEVYINDPARVEKSELRTEIYIPVK